MRILPKAWRLALFEWMVSELILIGYVVSGRDATTTMVKLGEADRTRLLYRNTIFDERDFRRFLTNCRWDLVGLARACQRLRSIQRRGVSPFNSA